MDTTATYVFPESQALKEQFAGIVGYKTLTKTIILTEKPFKNGRLGLPVDFE